MSPVVFIVFGALWLLVFLLVLALCAVASRSDSAVERFDD